MPGMQKVMATEHGHRITVSTMVPDGHKGQHFSSPHNDPYIMEQRVANTLVHRILPDIRSSADIITLDCLKGLKHLRKEITPFVQPILSFGG